MKQREKSCRITQTLTNCFKKKNNEALKKLLKELETKNQQLRESESKYRILTENISDSIWIMDLNTLKAEYVSPSVMKNRGYTQEEAKAQTLEQTLSPQSYETAIRILSEELEKEKDPAADPKRSRTMEIQETVKGGGYTWSETTVSFLRDQAGVPNKIMGVTRYIDERKKTEKQIAENEKKY
ncbi:MAG: PAS domain S-box protein, partial [Proteobacteria bacterium]|nr:PAS domain S-box protein [Pseudomonadota bacterium]